MSQDNSSTQDRIAAAERELAETAAKIEQSSIGSTRSSRHGQRPATSIPEQYSLLGKRSVPADSNRRVAGPEASSGAAPAGVASGSRATSTGYAAGPGTSPADPRQSEPAGDPDLQRAIEESRRLSGSSRSSGSRAPAEDEAYEQALRDSRASASSEQVRRGTRGLGRDVQGRATARGTGSMASGGTNESFVGLFANLSTAQQELLSELSEINGQDSYDSLTAGIGKLKKDEYLVLPHGFVFPDVQLVDVGKPTAHQRMAITDWANIYALNKAMAPAGADAATFGLLRLEAVKCGWGKDMKEVRFDSPPDNAIMQLADDMAGLRDKAADIKTASFLLPMAAEHTFRTMGHHFITTDQSNYVQRYSDTFRACLYPQLAGMLPPPVLYHTALHWIGPARVRQVVVAQLDTPSIPDAIRIRVNAAPAGTAILTTTAAIIDAMATVGLDAAFEKYGSFQLNDIRTVTTRVKASPCKYHKAYFAYQIARASADEMADLDTGKMLAEKFAPYAQAFVDTYLRDAALGRARAIKKHADNNPIQYRRAATLFRNIAREKVTSVADLIKNQLASGHDDDAVIV